MYLEDVYLFIGNEHVIKKNKIERILENVDPKTTDFIKYDLETISIQEVITDCMTIPFLKEKKVIIVKNPHFLASIKTPIKHDIKMLIKYLQNPTDTTILMIDAVGINIDKNSEVYKSFQKYSYIIDIKELDIIECKAWVKRSLSMAGATIGDEALNLLIEYLNGDLIRMEQEIEKLAAFRYNDRITESDIKALVSRNYEEDVFLLIKAITQKDRAQVTEIYQRISESVTDVMSIIGLISKTFNDLYTTLKLLEAGYSQNDIANIFGVKPGRAHYLIKDAKNFKLETLEQYVNQIVDLDYKIKNGLIDKTFGIEMFLLSL